MSRIESPHDPRFDELLAALRELAPSLEAPGAWPDRQLQWCGDAGVFAWFFPREWGGLAWSDAEILRGYVRLSAACLTTAFVITQRMAACARLLASQNEALQQELIPPLVTGRSFATVGLSHLTTSRRHLGKPVLQAQVTPQGYVLDGYSPWVTSGAHARTIVVGAELADGRQLLLALRPELTGVSLGASVQLMALTASQTGALYCRGVHLPADRLILGPQPEVMKAAGRAGSGGLATSALAIGLADAALGQLQHEAQRRADLQPPTDALRAQWQAVCGDMLALAEGQAVCSNEQVRTRANSLVLRATQAALAAVKGAGYVQGHPVGRWCREALFFLVWSCPQPVAAANLCELAGLDDEV